MRRVRNLFFFLVFSFLLPSCGEEVCIMGMGTCAIPQVKGNPSKPGEALSMSTTATRVKVNSKLLFTAKGGVKPYAYFVQGGGTIDKDSGAYIAGATASTDTISVKDAKETRYDIAITVYE